MSPCVPAHLAMPLPPAAAPSPGLLHTLGWAMDLTLLFDLTLCGLQGCVLTSCARQNPAEGGSHR